MTESILLSQETQAGSESSFVQGWRLFKSALVFIFKKPAFLVPLFLCWIVVAATVLYMRYWWVPTNSTLSFLEFFGFVFIISYAICLANLMLLELVKQIEDNQKVSFGKALAATVSQDAIKVIPLAVFFAIIWFIILILRALASKSRRGRASPSSRDAAQTLAGIPGGLSANPFSWLGLGLDLFEKLFRMSVFLALPAIAWEHEGSFSAFRRAVSIIKKYPTQFFSEYGLTLAAGIIMALPLIPIYVVDKSGGTFPNSVWYGVILYEGIVWTLGIYLEQITMTLLYLWQMKAETDTGTPDLSTFTKPDLLQDFQALKSSQV